MKRFRQASAAVALAVLFGCSPGGGSTGARVAPRSAPPPDPMCDAGQRAEYVLGEKDWPAEVRLDIIYGRVRVGFTKDQLLAARSTRDNRGGVAAMTQDDAPAPNGRRGTALVYPDETFVLVDGKVAEIQPTRVHELR